MPTRTDRSSSRLSRLAEMLTWRRPSWESDSSYVLLRSRYQPVTIGHFEAIESFFKVLAPAMRQEGRGSPKLCLAVVCDLLKGTDLGRRISELAQPGDALSEYLLRFSPEFNPLMPFEVIEDLLALLTRVPKEWHKHIAITLMPEFGCTIFALHSPLIDVETRYLLEAFLPPANERRWLIPRFDGDDHKDIEIAGSYGESVDILDQGLELSPYAYSTGNGDRLGLYGYATWCLLSNDAAGLRHLMPKSVFSRWQERSLFAKARARAIKRIDDINASLEAKLQQLLDSPSLRSFASAVAAPVPPEEPSPPIEADDFLRTFFGGTWQ